MVRLDGRDHYLGKHGSEASQEKYRRLIAEWLAVDPMPAGSTKFDTSDPLTISALILAYWQHAEQHYRTPEGVPTREQENMRDALRPLRRLYGTTDAHAFGPKSLRAVQLDLVAAGLSRKVINARIDRIRRVFKWAVGLELMAPSVHQALRAVSGLQRGRTTACEAPGVFAVPLEHVEAALPKMPTPIAAMVRIQLLTGCRPGEVIVMRGCDLKPGDPITVYTPASHKTAWRGKGRTILLGPRAREILVPISNTDPSAYLFDPRQASEAERTRRVNEGKVHRPTRVAVGGRAKPLREPGPKYTQYSYRQAIHRACVRAGVPPWCPLQLRHSAATAIRARFGLEAAQTVLGHARADVTQVYAERDIAKVHAIIAEVG